VLDWLTVELNNLWLVYLKLPLTTQWAVTLLLVAGFIVHSFSFTDRTVHDGPSIFTTAGIFFTFLGIAQGLYNFDTLKIETSIPSLLEGLKTAFVASVFGVGIALSIKLRFVLFGVSKRDSDAVNEDASVGDLVHQLNEVQKALVGEDDSTILSQLKLSRQDMNDKLDQLNRSQREFLANAADSNSKALIAALENAIADFNTKISEQFGENFKQLNIAVGQLLEWQDRYRTQMQEMIVQQSATTENMNVASERYSVLIERASEFSNISNSLSKLLTGLETQRDQITVSLGSLGEVLSKTSEGLPKLETKIVQLTEQMTFGVKSHQEQITNSITQGAKAIGDSVNNIKTLVLESTQSANQAINNHMNELARKTNEQVAKLDAALENELQKSISSLATQLTSLSRRFVQDYTPLTEELRKVISLAQGVR
jgi:hypothetical protein